MNLKNAGMSGMSGMNHLVHRCTIVVKTPHFQHHGYFLPVNNRRLTIDATAQKKAPRRFIGAMPFHSVVAIYVAFLFGVFTIADSPNDMQILTMQSRYLFELIMPFIIRQ